MGIHIDSEELTKKLNERPANVNYYMLFKNPDGTYGIILRDGSAYAISAENDEEAHPKAREFLDRWHPGYDWRTL